MLSNYKIPGFLLVSLGGLFLSSGGALFKLFENQDVWTIYFWRSFFFIPAVLIFLFFSSTNNIVKKFKGLGWIGIVCALLYATGSGAYMFAMKNTTVANVLFIISTQTFMLAIAGYFLLKEKINLSTLIAILMASIGIYIMIGTKISNGTALGNAFAFITPVCFTSIVMIIRKYQQTDMVPAVALSGLFCLIAGAIMSSNLSMSAHDFYLAFLFGALQYAPGFICLTLGSRTTESAKVGIFAFSEAIAGPIWAWIFINENPSTGVFVGGAIIFLALLLKSFKK
ncbi:MAG: DMT family transporter [Pelagibacteraceae bacterium]|nr:DMT family transporter [Pelagibacteraceae bacterium]